MDDWAYSQSVRLLQNCLFNDHPYVNSLSVMSICQNGTIGNARPGCRDTEYIAQHLPSLGRQISFNSGLPLSHLLYLERTSMTLTSRDCTRLTGATNTALYRRSTEKSSHLKLNKCVSVGGAVDRGAILLKRQAGVSERRLCGEAG